MGMYTELNCAFCLKKDTPTAVTGLLQHMAAEPVTGSKELQIPAHPLFESNRWTFMLTCDSYYFAGDTHSTVQWDEISEAYRVTIRCNLKNYKYEIEKFIDWITPYIDALPGDFLGYKRYEVDEVPTLLYHPNKWVAIKELGSTTEPVIQTI